MYYVSFKKFSDGYHHIFFYNDTKAYDKNYAASFVIEEHNEFFFRFLTILLADRKFKENSCDYFSSILSRKEYFVLMRAHLAENPADVLEKDYEKLVHRVIVEMITSLE